MAHPIRFIPTDHTPPASLHPNRNGRRRGSGAPIQPAWGTEWLPLLAMTAVLALCGWLVGASLGMVMALFAVVATMLSMPHLPVSLVMRLHGAIPLPPATAPTLFQITHGLAARAGLATRPQLFLLPRSLATAFGVGTSSEAGIAVSETLLRDLSPQELEGVVAHEIAHIASGDTELMRLGEVLGRITHFVSSVGLFLTLFAILFVEQSRIPLWVVFVLALAPGLIGILQLAVSRRREYAADQIAVALTGDPRGLISALLRIDRSQRLSLRRRLGKAIVLPAALRSHPETLDRVRRLAQRFSAPSDLGPSDLTKSWRGEQPRFWR